MDACAAEQSRRTLATGGNDLRRQHSNGCVDLLAPRYLAGALRAHHISVPMLIATKSSFLQLGRDVVPHNLWTMDKS